jgi:hypothetical protein
VQYCPDPSRLEEVNVGVVLFCPELSFLDLRLTKNNSRIARVFKGREFRPWTLDAAKNALAERLRSSSCRPRTAEEFQHFIDTRGNELVLTPSRPMKVKQPLDQLEALFEELVLEPARPAKERSGGQIPGLLQGVFARLVLEQRAQQDVRAKVPVVNRSIRCPYAYRNGALHYVKPQRFSPVEDSATGTAMRLAVEGDLLKRHGADAQGEKRLVVLASFAADDPNQSLKDRVLMVLAEYRVRAVSPEQVAAFAEEVQREAH